MNKRTITTFTALAAACFAGATAYAGTHTAPPSKPVKEVLAESCVTGNLGVDVVSNYISRGIVLENQGFIIQPYADLHFKFYKGSGPLNSITADIGIWNSFHDHRQFGAGTVANWFQFDFMAGLTFEIEKFSLSSWFKTIESPANAFPTAYTVGFKLAYDDRDILGDFALHPYVLAELQLAETTGNNSPRRGQYYEVGLTPDTGNMLMNGDLKVSLPLRGGFGSGGFYTGNKAFGFVSVGLDAAYALNFVPECLGKWTAHTGITYYYLGNGSADFVPAQIGATTVNGDRSQWVIGGGLRVAF